MFDKAPKPVDKKQAVWKARKWVGHLSLGDVRLRAGHSQSFSGIVGDGETPIQHPAKRTVLVEHPMLALEMRRRAVAVRGDLLLNPLPIGIVNSIEPLIWTVAYLVFAPPQHRFPTRRVIHAARLNIPIPKTVIGPAGRQGITFFALSQR